MYWRILNSLTTIITINSECEAMRFLTTFKSRFVLFQNINRLICLMYAADTCGTKRNGILIMQKETQKTIPTAHT